jgi:hypothetical protein
MYSSLAVEYSHPWVWFILGGITPRLGYISAIEIKMLLENYGNPCQGSIINVPFAIVTFGKLTVVYYPKSVIGQLAKSLDRLITLKGLIALCGNGLLV